MNKVTKVTVSALCSRWSLSVIGRRRNMSASTAKLLQYPALNSHRVDVVEKFQSAKHGTVEVRDPYRWLEDEEGKNTKEWIDAQVSLFDEYMAQNCAETSELLKKELTNRWMFERYSCPFKRGSRYYFYHNSGLQNQSVLYGKKSLDDEKYVVLDPNSWSADGTVALGTTAFSEDGKFMAYSQSKSGSDWNTIKVMNVEDLIDLPDLLDWVKFSSIAWLHSGDGFFYCRYPKPKKFEAAGGEDASKGTEVEKAANQMIFYHKLGTPQEDDVLIHRDPENPEWMFGVEVSDCGKYLIISVSESCEPANRVFYIDLESSKLEKDQSSFSIVKVIDSFEAEYSYITNEKTKFWFKTNLKAPNYKVISMTIEEGKEVERKDVIPHSESCLVNYVFCVNEDKLVVSLLRDVKEELRLYDLNGNHLETALEPSVLAVVGVSGRKNHSEIFIKVSSFVIPGMIYRMDLKESLKLKHNFLETRVNGLNSDEFVEKQVFVESKDGTKVPMFIVHRKNLVLNGQNPTLLYGYGGFNISLTPYFSVVRWSWVDIFDGVFAMANLRGGGEYGQEWHHSGTKLKKQNVFDDFHSCAEYLIKENYTCTPKLAVEGGSNGGLLIGACVNQRPDLYACGVAHVGVMDMLRFHRFTIGHAWCSDYGNADTNPEEFDALYAYSPVHNIQKVKSENAPVPSRFPAVLAATADHDDRVVPLHSLKYMATLQYELGESLPGPFLIRIEVKAGHGAGKPLTKTIQENAQILAFMGHITQSPAKSRSNI
eukprot:TRINITY_DN22315_c0_g1_i1.p1 TRINITY_DN22315_c0_g1~~TRINITY_DN22315_c0_g1_i1.p1  ORF type:complete len:766 (-),score=203.36 TRINITY_DN22315_c0_g1_i1:48-2345(-)